MDNLPPLDLASRKKLLVQELNGFITAKKEFTQAQAAKSELIGTGVGGSTPRAGTPGLTPRTKDGQSASCMHSCPHIYQLCTSLLWMQHWSACMWTLRPGCSRGAKQVYCCRHVHPGADDPWPQGDSGNRRFPVSCADACGQHHRGALAGLPCILLACLTPRCRQLKLLCALQCPTTCLAPCAGGHQGG